jgi:hypothetical protein
MMHTQKNAKQEQSKPKSKTREIIKNRAKINEIETKITTQRIMKQRVGYLTRLTSLTHLS